MATLAATLCILTTSCPGPAPTDGGPVACPEPDTWVGDVFAYPGRANLNDFLSAECSALDGDLYLWPESPDMPFLTDVLGDVRAEADETLFQSTANEWSCCSVHLRQLSSVGGTYAFRSTLLDAAGTSSVRRAAALELGSTSVARLSLLRQGAPLLSLGRQGTVDECLDLSLSPPCDVGGLIIEDNASLSSVNADDGLEIGGELTIRNNPLLPAEEVDALVALAKDSTRITTCGNLEDDPCDD